MYSIVQVSKILFKKSVNNFLPENKPDYNSTPLNSYNYIVFTALKTYVNPL